MNRIDATSPAQRNKGPIFEQLAPLLRTAGSVLEIGAGDGTHARHARDLLPGVRWQATEHPARMHLLQDGLAACDGLPAAIALDVTADWPPGPFAAVYAANVTHIMAWPMVEALFAGAPRVLEAGGLLCVYGPFLDDEVETAPGNLEFDRRLRRHDPSMGLRRLQALASLARKCGLSRRHDWAMPANNRLLVWSLS